MRARHLSNGDEVTHPLISADPMRVYVLERYQNEHGEFVALQVFGMRIDVDADDDRFRVRKLAP